MWSTEQSVIITEHSNCYEQMTLVIKQIKESGPDAPKPSLPKRPKSKLDSLFTQAKTFLVRVKAWHEDKYDKNEIKESWRDWLKTNIDYSDRYARRLRNLSRGLEGYPRFGLVGLPVSYFTAGKLKDITEMLSNPEYAEYWRQPLPATTNETPLSQ
ncbi:unnamed protein product [Mytilus coruscus]|uniref:Uncharacterized protein n=1 Tax=Mytilus coruscus TaxID=42192 RepID=A0A6J8AR22_MYTCO|nr:unnamed protein product [Mytilus coruscus]